MKEQQLYYLSKDSKNELFFAISLWPDRVEHGYVPNKNADRHVIWARNKKYEEKAKAFLNGMQPMSLYHLRNEHLLIRDIFGDYR
jgi:hypothetical protein